MVFGLVFCSLVNGLFIYFAFYSPIGFFKIDSKAFLIYSPDMNLLPPLYVCKHLLPAYDLQVFSKNSKLNYLIGTQNAQIINIEPSDFFFF